MPVTINGNGSITGLVAGGLPAVAVIPADGSITTAKLANGSVTSGKLASGAVSVDANTMPVGSILQVQTAKNTAQHNMNSNSYGDKGYTIQITPNFSNSKIILTCYLHFELFRSHQESSWMVQIRKNGSTLKVLPFFLI